VIPSTIEPVFWLVIFLISAYLIAKYCTNRYFLHGLLVSIFNSIWITIAHVLFYDKYMSIHPQELKMVSEMPANFNPKLTMLVTGPLIGVLSGLILGLFSYLASIVFKRKSSETDANKNRVSRV
jgi:hypothetical protein